MEDSSSSSNNVAPPLADYTRDPTGNGAMVPDRPLPLSPSPPPKPKAVIGYAISLIRCKDFQTSTAGLQDAAIVLKHSMHQTSIRNWPASGSHYDYQAYAIVHRQAAGCASILEQAGYTVLIRAQPVQRREIRGDFLRQHIRREWCCGAAEFVKLYAYNLTQHPIVVHVDIDFAFVRPMDDLFDSILSSSSSARQKVHLEHAVARWPDNVTAFMTRDWGQVQPGRRPLFQAGFLVIRPDPAVLEFMIETIKEGNFEEGMKGWGGKGYGGLVGAMATQGLIAYVYDQFYATDWLELNQCRYNHMGMDVLYRSHPNFTPNHPKVGQCRNNLDYCEDCQHTPLSQIYNIHYTQCRKPWNCIGEGDSTLKEKTSIPEDSVDLEHCMELLSFWHSLRRDLEEKLLDLTGDASIRQGQIGTYKEAVFRGHCVANGQYLPLAASNTTRSRIHELYGSGS